MRVERFGDQYEATATLCDLSASELRKRDEAQAQPLQRWIAWDGDAVTGAVSTWLRPDDRMFVFFAGTAGAIGPLTAAASTELGRSLHATVDDSARARVDALSASGFGVEAVNDSFTVPFDAALRVFGRAPVPQGFTIVSAAEVDVDRLFTLDNTVRQEVPGCDGWRGDREWFRSEIAERPPFDPDGYLVGIDETTGEYAGLIRIWRNPSGPRFGLVGVARQYRNTLLAAALLRRGLESASTWGSATFTAETSPDNSVVHHRMRRIGAVHTGRFLQMVCA